MSEISLAVTKKVLDYAGAGREKERQIAFTAPSEDIAGQLSQASTKHHVALRFGGRITLVVGDRGAIWRAHNVQYFAEFDALFAFLSQWPSQPMRFLCEVVQGSSLAR